MYWGMQYLTIICLLHIFLMMQEGEVVILFSCDKERKGNRNQSTQTQEKAQCLFCCCSATKSLTLWPHGLQHARLLGLPLSPGVCSNWCPLNWWCYLTILSSAVTFSFCFCFPSTRVFSNDLALHIRRPKYWSFNFSISPSNEYSQLISFRIFTVDFL